MKKEFSTFCLMSFLFISSAHADAESDYKNLCSYDQKWCRKLKNSDGTFVKPKKEIILLLKELEPIIKKNAASLGVDPRAIAGSIMAENSLNVSISDDVQDLLVRIGVAKKGEILGKKFTYGLGQLNFGVAREAENYMAKIENREPVSDAVLSEALLIPEKAIYYVGAVLRKCQDDYKNQGIDIAGKPEILTTLYNLGHSDIKSIELKNSGGTPKPNYFGFFVDKYKSELSFLSPSTPEKKPIIATTPTIKTISLTPTKLDEGVKEVKLAFTKSMPLYSAPPTCNTGNNYGAIDIQNKYDSMKSFKVSVIADKEKTFKVIAPSIDCETNTWELIKLSSGETGWIKKDDLDKSTAKIAIAKSNCTTTPDLKCIKSLKEKFKDKIITVENGNKSENFVNPVSMSKTIAFKKPDWACQKNEEAVTSNGNPPPSPIAVSSPPTNPTGGMFGYPGNAINPFAPIAKVGKSINSDEALVKILDLISDKEKEIENTYKTPIKSPLNPFYGIPLTAFKDNIEQCKNKQAYNLKPCQLDLAQVKLVLNAIDVTKRPSKDDRDFFNFNLLAIPTGAVFLPKDVTLTKVKNSMGGMYSGYMGGVGLGGFGSFDLLDAQYAFREEDESLWKLDDVALAFNECNLSIDELKTKINNSKKLDNNEKQIMNQFIKQMSSEFFPSLKYAIETLKKMSDEDKNKYWPAVQGEFVQTAKMCLSLKDTFDLNIKPNVENPALKNYYCYYQNLSVLESGTTLMMKDLVKETMFSGNGFQMLGMQFNMAFNPFKMMGLGLAPNMFGGGNNGGGGLISVFPTVIEAPPSYCPNLTAEMIEETVKNNPCITKVNVPDKWLINRLNELGDKVIFKPFADDDRFSFEMETTVCK